MFGKLKEKLKGWFKSSKETIEETAPKQEIKEEKPKKPKEKKKPKKEIKKEKEKKQQEIKEKELAIKQKEEEIKKQELALEKEEKKIQKQELALEKKLEKEIKELEEKKKLEEEEKAKAELALKEKAEKEIKELKEKEKLKKEAEELEKQQLALEKELEKEKQELEEKKKLEEEEKAKAELALKEKEEKLKKEAEELEKQQLALEKELEEQKQELEKIKEQEREEEKAKKEAEELEKAEKKSFFQKLKSKFTYKITQEEFDAIFEDLEMLLLENNVALEVTEDLKIKLSKKLIGREIPKDQLEQEIKTELKNSLDELLIEPDDPLDAIKMKSEKPFTILFFGINGTGKTTSIAKIAHFLKKANLKVVLAAADTFRAASIEQISEHANKLNVPLIKHDYGSDPAAVGFDAIKYAKKQGIDVVLIDTAGRMHTKGNLMAEMEKICRVTNPDLKIFVAESIAGNDATEQAKTFHEAIEIDGSILSKADIDEKGGTIISVSHATKRPIFYLGTGQKYNDLQLFNKQKFIESLGL